MGSDNRHVLWVGDAGCTTGFARCTHSMCDQLHTLGWTVDILGINYFGDPHRYPYRVWPCRQPFDGGLDAFGEGRLPILVDRLRPDVVVLQNDPWNIAGYIEAMSTCAHKPKVVGYLAVDGKNQHAAPLNMLDGIVVWTDWAREELLAGGCNKDIEVIPLGVDLSVFAPMDKVVARSRTCPPELPANAFIVGYVGRNQPRKRLDLTISYFSRWIASGGVDAYLYLYVAPTRDCGVDIRSLVKYYGVSTRVILSEPELTTVMGAPDHWMTSLYNSFDVFFTTTQGEGWGLPVLEAMACGVPVVAPNWSGIGSWAKDAALLVDCTATALTAPINGLVHTIGGIPDPAGSVWALSNLYVDHPSRKLLADRGLELAQRLSWSSAKDQFGRYMDGIV